jgi:chromosome segregation ATPase
MNMQEHINDLIEYKRLVIKLEDELKKKSSENAILSKQNLDLKSLCQDLQIECDELNKKLISKNSEMKKLDKKYKDEMDKLSKNFEKQKEIYEEKILKLSSINPINKEIAIKREVEVRYEEKLKEKNEEIGILNNKIKNLSDENYDLRFEIERIKSLQNKFDVIKQENDLMKDLVRQEDNQKEGNIIDNNNDNKLKEMQLIIKEKEEYIEKLCQEINKLKNEKNIYETNLSKKYFIDLGQITELENKNNLLKRDLLKKDEVIKDIENRLLDLRKVAEKINKEKEEMEQENNNLLTKINELEKEKENNNDEIQKDLDNLRELVQNYETEQHNNIIINEKKKKMKNKIRIK